ncbi:HAUS augmin-like complex subunit 8 [Stylophora pistillata]|uniref:HAUS augmin-like complex subunit 8 n=1 Tax=Stylophora pistillata TaxID=50429 RepID=A0A2B4SVZ9_STYPI|nr:HAUS augmin-like complex subunit 8 [Stylophora pistillata]
MAANSKRSLYNPAPSQTPPPQIRKSLAQGFLVSKPITGFPSSAPSSVRPTSTHIPDSTYTEERESEQTSPVLLVDARGQHKSPDLAEVPVVTGIVKSPVRVVCHSPRHLGRDRSTLENSVVVQRSDNLTDVTGDLEEGRKVKVAGIPRVNLLESSVRKKDLSHSSPESRGSGEETFMDYDRKGAEATLNQQQISRPREEFKSFLGEDGFYAPPPSSHLSTPQIKQQLFDFSSVSDSHSQAPDGDQSILPAGEKQNLKTKKKKQKTARIVQSRYMATGPKVTKKVAVKEVPLPPKKKVKVPSATSAKSRDQSFLTHSNNSTLGLNVITPFIRHTSNQKGIVTSTPADGMAGVDPAVHVGASTPILPQGVATFARRHGGSGGTNAVKKTSVSRDKQKQQPVVVKKAGVKAGPVGTSVGEGDISQRQLELQYSRVVQASFLYSRLKHSFGQKEKDAQSQIYHVWQEKEKLQREVADLELQLKMKMKIAELDKQIKLQMSGLEPIGSNMVKLILEYSKLAAALDTTRHHMSVNGVLLPDNHDQLFAVLDESERLLGEIDALSKENQQKIVSFAKEMEGLSKIVDSEIQEQNRCGELLAAASTLNTQERSLQAQSITAGL